jgi:hypothetical protein
MKPDENVKKALEERTVVIGGIWLIQNQLKKLDEQMGKVIDYLEKNHEAQKSGFDILWDRMADLKDQVDEIHTNIFAAGRNQL